MITYIYSKKFFKSQIEKSHASVHEKIFKLNIYCKNIVEMTDDKSLMRLFVNVISIDCFMRYTTSLFQLFVFHYAYATLVNLSHF